jgi:hypothetical protein
VTFIKGPHLGTGWKQTDTRILQLAKNP